MERPDQIRQSFQVLDKSIATPSLFRQSFITPSVGSRFRETAFDDAEVTMRMETPGKHLDPTIRNFQELEEATIKGPNLLFVEFHNALQFEKPINTAVFELIQEFEELCQKQVNFLTRLIEKTRQNIYEKPLQLCVELVAERNTWRLLKCLYTDRLKTNEVVDLELDMEVYGASEQTIVDRLYEKDHGVRQAQLVLDWLEKNQRDISSNQYERTEFFQDVGVAWENTLHALENQTSSRPIVTSLDLDAPIRQDKPLHDQDREDCERLNKDLFAMIRCGQLDAAIKLCLRVGQPWRAATLEGWRLYHDPNLHSNENKELEHVEGNPHRDIWRAVCWGIAEDKRISLTERAMYASLCGHLNALLPMCKTWEDVLWAYLRILVDCKVENYIRMCSPDRNYVALPDEFNQNKLTVESIFREVAARYPSSKESLCQMVQRHVIQDNTAHLVSDVNACLSTNRSRHSVRFLAHLVLVLKALGRLENEIAAVPILEAYVSCLIEMNEKELVASYTAELPRGAQIKWYAKFLRTIQEQDDRFRALQLALESGLDVDAITSTLVENIRKEESEDDDPARDKEKLGSIEWLLINPSQRMEALRQGNALMRHFLILNKTEHAKKILKMIPEDSVGLVIRQSGLHRDDLTPKLDNILRENLCHQAYLSAVDAFNDWLQQANHGVPVEPEAPSKGAPYTERVAWELKNNQYKADKKAWEGALQHYTKTACECLYNVLLFPDGGWMVDRQQDPEPEENRDEELMALQQLVLPQVTSLLHKVHFSMKQYSECLRLADVVVPEKNKPIQAFQKEEIKRLCERIFEASKALLDGGQNPLGYTRC